MNAICRQGNVSIQAVDNGCQGSRYVPSDRFPEVPNSIFAVILETTRFSGKVRGSWVSVVSCSWVECDVEGQRAVGEAGVEDGLGRWSSRAPLLQARKLKAAPTRWLAAASRQAKYRHGPHVITLRVAPIHGSPGDDRGSFYVHSHAKYCLLWSHDRRNECRPKDQENFPCFR